MTEIGLRERKRIDTRARIVEAACAMFESRGIEEVTVDEIAAAADVGKGTVYNYFGAKEDIVVAFLVEVDRPAVGAMASLPLQGMSVAEALDAAAWSLLENKEPHHAFVRAYLARLFLADSIAFELAEFQAQLDAALTALFTRLLARPGMRRALPVAELVQSFKTMHLGLTAAWALEGAPFANARQITRRHMYLLAKGLEL
ncbi:TetR/AcrR family transcriptional regulator [Sphingomonas canadensis]|uniref:TetR/AcrR family transcriptional regulator n=1 Tax=Sphingomonas canadensis TaxID=1219257 RepID=A0ABW3HD71_9SPHN|nr:TetR/AcrR family transcriptional regulator [Sphingomonas canadensis]MCW3838086.1 TetR/AcrR family transcriptional regulator [Sphingomonas canadensis]